jgi:phosphate transport system permease protein
MQSPTNAGQPESRRVTAFKAPRDSAAPAAQMQQRRIRRSVYIYDKLARSVVSLGGLAVIAAVLAICFYLVSAALPLFHSGKVAPGPTAKLAGEAAPIALAVDEYRGSIALLAADGALRLTELGTGALIEERAVLPPGRTPTAWSFEEHRGLVAIGYDDGSIQLGKLEFASRFPTPEELSEEQRRIPIGSSIPFRGTGDGQWGGVLERLQDDQYRLTVPALELRDPVALDRGSGAIRAIDYRTRTGGEFLVALREDGTGVYDLVRTVRPLGGGAPRIRLTHYDLPIAPPEGRGHPDRLFVTGEGASVLALWNDGYVQRYASRDPANHPIVLAESLRLLEPESRVTTAAMLLGGISLLVGDDRGSIYAAFAATDEAAATPDRQRLVVAHRLRIGDSPVTSIGISRRDRSIVAGDSSGALTVYNILSEKRVARIADALDSPVLASVITPKVDGVVAVGEDRTYRAWAMNPGHTEASFKSLFLPVHYEGAAEPQFVYQSSSGEDSAEPKLSIVPLIVGTLKATIFAMLFAAPIAVLAAIYTSEFMSPRLRNSIKPGIEMMASLPSVVLGFVAAIIIAPYMAKILPAVLIGFAVVPMGILLAAHIWQLIPTQYITRISSSGRLALIGVVLVVSLAAAGSVGPAVERALFRPSQEELLVAGGLHQVVPQDRWPAWVGPRQTMSPDQERRLRSQGFYFQNGEVVRPIAATPEQRQQALGAAAAVGFDRPSIRRWLDGNIGGPWPGWALLMMIPASIIVVVLQARFVNRRFNAIMSRKPPLQTALWQLGKFTLALAAIIVMAVALAALATRMGYDTRDLIFGPFTMRNTLVVGLIMGFAIIPIIYTISEDAMNSVPASLRSASLGSGATQWQTAVRIILPVAGSGIFSACMIGLGRAVGETMIVVMATGNTPSMDMNIFSGFRTLSANIAVELPEAPNHSTHFSVLFLCGLVLFAMTFAVNTTAEIVRQHFRRLSASL